MPAQLDQAAQQAFIQQPVGGFAFECNLGQDPAGDVGPLAGGQHAHRRAFTDHAGNIVQRHVT